MFWDSVTGGIGVLFYWETYVAALEYLTIYFIPIFIMGYFFMRNEDNIMAGCLGILLLSLIQVAATAIFIFTLFPIILGISDDAFWSFPWRMIYLSPIGFLKIVGFMALAGIITAFIPIVGRLNSLSTLIVGGVGLAFVIDIIDVVYPNVIPTNIDFIPGFWFIVGLLIIGGLVSLIGFMVTALILTAIKLDESIAQIWLIPIGAIFGFIPVFMYGAWLGAQIKGSF